MSLLLFPLTRFSDGMSYAMILFPQEIFSHIAGTTHYYTLHYL